MQNCSYENVPPSPYMIIIFMQIKLIFLRKALMRTRFETEAQENSDIYGLFGLCKVLTYEFLFKTINDQTWEYLKGLYF